LTDCRLDIYPSRFFAPTPKCSRVEAAHRCATPLRTVRATFTAHGSSSCLLVGGLQCSHFSWFSGPVTILRPHLPFAETGSLAIHRQYSPAPHLHPFRLGMTQTTGLSLSSGLSPCLSVAGLRFLEHPFPLRHSVGMSKATERPVWPCERAKLLSIPRPAPQSGSTLTIAPNAPSYPAIRAVPP
jgi:hypothetical protein